MADPCVKSTCCSPEIYSYRINNGSRNPPPISTYLLTLEVDPDGTGTTTGAGTYQGGMYATISATPESGYAFAGWTGDFVSTENPVQVYMDASKTITANFEEFCPCSNLTLEYLLRTIPASTVQINSIEPSPDTPPTEGWVRRKACYAWVCACVAAEQEVTSITQYGAAGGLDLTEEVFAYTAIPNVPGCYIYRFEFFGWRGPYIAPGVPRGWESSNTKFLLSQQTYPNINA